jgi:thymidylate kinase
LAGTPRAGKTTAIEGVKEQLQRDGRQVQVVEEQARRCRVPDKRNADFHRWTYASTMQRIVEARYGGADIVLVDRGFFDTLAWNEWYRRSGKLSASAYEAYGAALREELAELVDLVVVMTVSPDTAIRRDGRAVGDPGGSIINRGVLSGINRAIEEAVVRSQTGGGFRLVRVDTTRIDRETMLERVTEQVIDFLSGARNRPGRAGGPTVVTARPQLLTGLDPLSTPV